MLVLPPEVKQISAQDGREAKYLGRGKCRRPSEGKVAAPQSLLLPLLARFCTVFM
jgi:hypothetical protein